MTDPAGPEREDPEPGAPFSFKLMLVLMALYLGWRLVEGAVALYRWIT